jgi:hypothetical protein
VIDLIFDARKKASPRIRIEASRFRSRSATE